MKTTIDLNGLRIEHNGEDSVLLISEAPTEIAISDLIGELNSLLPQTEEVGKPYHFSQQSLCTPHGGSSRITELG